MILYNVYILDLAWTSAGRGSARVRNLKLYIIGLYIYTYIYIYIHKMYMHISISLSLYIYIYIFFSFRSTIISASSPVFAVSESHGGTGQARFAQQGHLQVLAKRVLQPRGTSPFSCQQFQVTRLRLCNVCISGGLRAHLARYPCRCRKREYTYIYIYMYICIQCICIYIYISICIVYIYIYIYICITIVPWSRNSGATLCAGELHPSKMRSWLGSNPRCSSFFIRTLIYFTDKETD